MFFKTRNGSFQTEMIKLFKVVSKRNLLVINKVNFTLAN